jgi:hypothetical protein
MYGLVGIVHFFVGILTPLLREESECIVVRLHGVANAKEMRKGYGYKNKQGK